MQGAENRADRSSTSTTRGRKNTLNLGVSARAHCGKRAGTIAKQKMNTTNRKLRVREILRWLKTIK